MTARDIDARLPTVLPRSLDNRRGVSQAATARAPRPAAARAARSRAHPALPGQTLARRLRKLGLETAGDLLAPAAPLRERRPEAPIAQLFGDEEVAIAGVVRSCARGGPAAG